MALVVSTSRLPDSRQQALASGDHLTRDEFERRYAATPEGTRAELIEGVVYTSPPVRYRDHGKPFITAANWLGHYSAKTPGLLGVGGDSTVRLGLKNEFQPDLFLMLPPHLGGRATIDADGYIAGPPTLVCEIAGSTVSIDLHTKKDIYRQTGVQEYLVWRTEDEAFDWFVLEDGNFVAIPPQVDGLIYSRTLVGLCLDPRAMLAADLPAIFALLDKTAATPDHSEFVAKLKA